MVTSTDSVALVMGVSVGLIVGAGVDSVAEAGISVDTAVSKLLLVVALLLAALCWSARMRSLLFTAR